MPTRSPVIPELQDLAKHGNARRRGEVVGRVAELFMAGAARFNDTHVEVFDQVLQGLAAETEVKVRADLSERLADIPNAPRGIVGQLARDTEIKVAAPVLRRSPLIDEPTLIDIARMKGQSHLSAISERSTLSTSVTDVILRRGERDVVRKVAANAGAQFSESGYSGLIKRATDDGMLALAVGQREDISPNGLKELLSKSVDIVRRKLFEVAKPKQKAAINKAMIEISGAPKAQLVTRDFEPAQRAVLALHRRGELHEAALLAFAKEHKYEEAVAALSALTGMRLATVNQLVLGDRYDPILLLGKSAGFDWATVRALIVLRLGPGKIPPGPDIEDARVNFERLSQTTAQRVLAFWRQRDKAKIA